MARAMFAEFCVRPGHEDDAAQLVTRLAEAVRREPGNSLLLPYRIGGSPARYHIHEVYADEAAFQAHLRSVHTKAFNAGLERVAEGGASTVTDLDAVAAMPVPEAWQPRGIDHAGITVPDIEAASAFLARAFGAERVYDVQRREQEPMAGPEVERQLGLPQGARIVQMRLMRIGQGPTLELFQVEGAEPAPPAGLADRGLTHLGLYVDDIGAAAARFEAAGGELLSAPHPLSGVEDGEGNAGAYGRTPWGMLVELITYPAGISYPPGSAVTRWTPERI